MTLKCVIVDDEEMSRYLLHASLNEYCPQVEVIGEAESVRDARQLIEAAEPEVVFMDIQMPNGSGFELLQARPHTRPFKVVFVTAYKQYAIEAIKAGASDYLLKPIDAEELKVTVGKLYTGIVKDKQRDAHLFPDTLDQNFVIKHVGGFSVIHLRDIIALEGSDNYTHIFLQNGAKLTVTRTLKYFEDKLGDGWFIRVHKSHIINLCHLKEYLTEDGGYALMTGGKRVPVSRFSMNDMFGFVNQCTTGRLPQL